MTTATYGARNKIKGKVTDIKSDAIMSQVNFETASGQLSSVLTTESVQEMNLKLGDEVHLIIKAIHVLPVKNA
ncbi:MAG: TOBE domain-containing protein [Candidatus Melainabacteria bacterium]|nr:TOBE domain-containing protein [Candidatus Melainabacteria bacterium]